MDSEAVKEAFEIKISSHNRTIQKAFFRKLTSYISELFQHKNTSYYLCAQDKVVSFLAQNSSEKCLVDLFFATAEDDLPVKDNLELSNILKREFGII